MISIRKIYIAFIFSFTSFIVLGQSLTIHGFLPVNDPDSEFIRLGTVDPFTGQIIEEDSIFPVNGYALGSSAFDAINKAYMFIGVDTDFNFKLYTRSLRTETTLFDPLINTTINDLQFDMNSTNTYGLGNYAKDSILIDSINDIWQYDYATRFIKVDQDSGYITELLKMPDIEAFVAGSSTFDANNGRYIINAFDTAFTERILILDAASGNLFSNEPANLAAGASFVNLEYNNEDNKVYGLYRGNNNTFIAIASMDIYADNAIDTVFVFNDLLYFVQGSVVFDQATQHYIMYYIDTLNTNRLALIDVVAKEMTANPTIQNYLTELEADNTEYALAKYHETVGLNNISNSFDFRLYPNPVSQGSILNFDSKIKPDKIVISDLQGRKIQSKNGYQLSGRSIKLQLEARGIYIVEFHSSGIVQTQLLVVY